MQFAIDCLGSPHLASPLEVPSPATFVDDGKRIFLDPHEDAVAAVVREGGRAPSFEVAGPRRALYFEPSRTRVAIATCGGLSPGLNDVIRGLVLQLHRRYGVREIYGARYGFRGLLAEELVPLGPESVRGIHEQGGSVLGTSRGGPEVGVLAEALARHRVDVFFPIGGDGTLRGAAALCTELASRGLEIGVVGLPKTIDNDIPWVRRSFGFESAVRVATAAIRSASVEARGVHRGVGLVKLMGRHAGYIAATATLSAGGVDYCLVPEVPFSVDRLLEEIEERLGSTGQSVVVVAEGAGQEYVQPPAGPDADASGNARLGDIGLFLESRIEKHFRERQKAVSVKYIEPSYMVRSSPADAGDALYCTRLAQNAVHAALSGRTAMYVGFWHGRMTHVPFSALEGQQRSINPLGELWWNVLEATGQPTEIA